MRTAFRMFAAAAMLAFSVPAQAQPAMPDPTPATPQEEAAAVEWLSAKGVVFDPSAATRKRSLRWPSCSATPG